MCALWLLDNESAKVVLGSTTEITKGPAYSFFTRWLGSGLLIGNGEVWRKMRKIVTPAFPLRKDRGILGDDGASRSSTEIDLYPAIKHCALDIIAGNPLSFTAHHFNVLLV
ncbi:Cytochrome P450 [Aphelenchoides fujianensis]|nr:Cytochrome P450 [Aphelenchoides fujianensis]